MSIIYSKASLRIIGKFIPEEISGQLGYSPSFITRRGDKLIRSDPPMKVDVWGIESPLRKDAALEKHLRWVIEKYKAKRDIFTELGKKHKIDIFCAITAAGVGGFSLSHKDTKIIGDLGLTLEVSLIMLEP